MEASTSFTAFMKLPSELRIKIWNYTLPGARVVSVRFNRRGEQYISTTPPPSLLHVCAESRFVFLSTYANLILVPKYKSSVFVDFAHDTIFFDSLECSPGGDLAFDLALSPQNDRILSCAIDVQLWEVLRVFRTNSLSELRWMKNVKTFALIMRKENGHQPRQIDVDSGVVTEDIRHGLWYVESLSNELQNSEHEHWGNGIPNVQLWLW